MFRSITSTKYKAVYITQNIIPQKSEPIYACTLHENELTKPIFDAFLLSATGKKIIGVAPIYNRKHNLTMLALSTETDVLVIKLSVKSSKSCSGHYSILKTLFMNAEYKKYAFHMDKLSTTLFVDHGLLIRKGMDILSGQKDARYLYSSKVKALGGKPLVDPVMVAELFRDEGVGTTDISVIVVQAWAAYVASLIDPVFEIREINTTSFRIKELRFLAKTIRELDLLHGLQPTVLKNEIEKHDFKKGKMVVTSSRYKTRIMRPGSNQVIKLEFDHEGLKTKQNGNTIKIEGRTVQFHGVRTMNQADKLKIYTIGREDPTCAEASRTRVILEILQNRNTFLKDILVQDIWFREHSRTQKPQIFPTAIQLDYGTKMRPLNSSQMLAAEAILSNEGKTRITIIQGPPGTGKTTVIAAAVLSLIASTDQSSADRTVWLIAQSNVAVKNIAEKLVDVDFFDFTLLVSKDFHFDWHEHIYPKVQKNIIRSDRFADGLVAAEEQLAGSRVILCTLSMLSNERISQYVQLVPPTLLIFDEASQIEVGDYIPLLDRFKTTIKKMVFIGDDKQLPPYGQNDVKGLQSVFEFSHLREKAIFLDTQYRMPLHIGNVLSQRVYNNKLKTQHAITHKLCCRFIDVARGQEKSKGSSWINEEQANIVTVLSRHMQTSGYKFRIITPYDAQRGLLETSLRGAELDWEDKVFNVDSFQGNEADYIIISLVKTNKIGFLNDLRRVNVMLSRCKKGMIIVTSRHFISTIAKGTLVSAMEKAFGNTAWIDEKAVLQTGFRIF